MIVLPLDFLLLLVPLTWNPEQWKATVAMAALSVVLLSGGRRYRARLHLSVLDELPSILGRLFSAGAIVATVIALRNQQEEVATFLVSGAAGIGLVVLGRGMTTWLISAARRYGRTRHRTIMLGGGRLAAELAETLVRDSRYGLELVGFVDETDDAPAVRATPRLGRLADLQDAVRASGADVLLIADGDFAEQDLLDLLRMPACVPCDLLIVPRMHHFHTQTGMPDRIGSVPVMRILTPSLEGPARMVKRGFDMLVAGVALIIVAPLLAACAVAVRVEGGPGVIFRQQRVGRDGIIFDCLKLRSMRPADETDSATTWSVANDNRVGRVGRFLRRTSLDELPQLWNILRGDMTLVGPRPERPHFVDRFSQQFERYGHRHRVQAGLTGLAQVSGLRGDTSIADRARYDNYYIENWSLWLDIKIIIRTFSEVFFARGR
ncbi:MAG: sugar transferase [Pseudonocardia sp.]|nr:sugar transferase [Pseudonocardia sp.]